MGFKTKMQQLEAGLRDSINSYNKILVLLQNMTVDLGTASHDELLKMSVSLGEMQGLATQLDQSILEKLQTVPERSVTMISLLEERESILKEVLLLNGSVTAKAMGVTSLFAHEIKTLRTGLSVMKGYSQPENDQGRIVNRSS